jgi:tetratricopeptide (TPR) repeat protein
MQAIRQEVHVKTRKNTQIISILFFLVATAAVVCAQGAIGIGRIRGTVNDVDGNPLPNVTLIAKNIEHNVDFKSVSDKKGQWSIGGLGSAQYRIVAMLEGYEPAAHDMKVTQFSSNNNPVDFVLKKNQSVESELTEEKKLVLTDYNEGLRLFGEMNYSEAMIRFEEFLQNNPDLIEVNINIGNCHKELREYDKAQFFYQLVIDKIREDKGTLEGNETAAKALANIGELYMEKEEFDKAREYLKQAVELFPGEPTMAYKVGEIYFKRGDTDNGIVYYKLAIEAKAGWGPPYRQLGYAYLNKGEYASAVEAFKKYLEIEPEGSQAATVRNLLPQIEKMIKK